MRPLLIIYASLDISTIKKEMYVIGTATSRQSSITEKDSKQTRIYIFNDTSARASAIRVLWMQLNFLVLSHSIISANGPINAKASVLNTAMGNASGYSAFNRSRTDTCIWNVVHPPIIS